MLFKISILKNFTIFTGKHLCWSLYLIKLQALRVSSNKYYFYLENVYTNILSHRQLNSSHFWKQRMFFCRQISYWWKMISEKSSFPLNNFGSIPVAGLVQKIWIRWREKSWSSYHLQMSHVVAIFVVFYNLLEEKKLQEEAFCV